LDEFEAYLDKNFKVPRYESDEPLLSFEHFMDVYRISGERALVLANLHKHEFIDKRRALLKSPSSYDDYKKVCFQQLKK